MLYEVITSLLQRIAEAFLHVCNCMDVDCKHHQQREAVAERQQPEGGGGERLARGELAARGGRRGAGGAGLVVEKARQSERGIPRVTARGQRSDPGSRITSYNVFYTKSLRVP